MVLTAPGGGGPVIDLVKERNDRLLVRHSDVDAESARVPQAGDELAQPVGGDVPWLVGAVESDGVQRGLLEHRRYGVADGVAYDAQSLRHGFYHYLIRSYASGDFTPTLTLPLKGRGNDRRLPPQLLQDLVEALLALSQFGEAGLLALHNVGAGLLSEVGVGDQFLNPLQIPFTVGQFGCGSRSPSASRSTTPSRGNRTTSGLTTRVTPAPPSRFVLSLSKGAPLNYSQWLNAGQSPAYIGLVLNSGTLAVGLHQGLEVLGRGNAELGPGVADAARTACCTRVISSSAAGSTRASEVGYGAIIIDSACESPSSGSSDFRVCQISSVMNGMNGCRRRSMRSSTWARVGSGEGPAPFRSRILAISMYQSQ